jgi:hypothetical protein
MKSYLFLGLGPISRRLIESLISLNLDSNIGVITSRNIPSYWPKTIKILKLNEIANSQEKISYDFIFNSWKSLSDEKGNEKVACLKRLRIRNIRNSCLINFSTVGVYGSSEIPATELTPYRIINSYCSEKRNFEVLLENLFENDLINFRVSNVFGDSAFPDLINKAMIAHASNGQFNLVEPDKLSRDFLHIDTLVCIIKLIISSVENDTDFKRKFTHLNVATGVSLKLIEVIQKIERISNTKCDFTVISLDSYTIQNSHIDVSLLKSLYPNLDLQSSGRLDSYIFNYFRGLPEIL